jgi:hypothetical protein
MQFLCNEPRLPDVFVNFTLPRAAVRLPPPPAPPPASPGSLTPPAPHCPGFAPRRRCAVHPAGEGDAFWLGRYSIYIGGIYRRSLRPPGSEGNSLSFSATRRSGGCLSRQKTQVYRNRGCLNVKRIATTRKTVCRVVSRRLSLEKRFDEPSHDVCRPKNGLSNRLTSSDASFNGLLSRLTSCDASFNGLLRRITTFVYRKNVCRAVARRQTTRSTVFRVAARRETFVRPLLPASRCLGCPPARLPSSPGPFG